MAYSINTNLTVSFSPDFFKKNASFKATEKAAFHSVEYNASGISDELKFPTPLFS
jgi:hypothetical protein